ncbi:MAG: hypothetical protein M1829_005634 [Trizodia sp. TS-e1964]|nr:MAG: hypothetical protein M1829_005634 [Trizodia sp. TS-e1964]
MNLSLPYHLLKLLPNPALCLPHHTIPSLAHLPTLPLHRICAIVLDKDNCLAAPGALSIHPPYTKTLDALRALTPPPELLIVSNSAGSAADAPAFKQAAALEESTGIRVLRHGGKKPGCAAAVMAALGSGVRREQVLVVGDRLGTDVLMANLMGARAVWVREGVVPDRGLIKKTPFGGGGGDSVYVDE